MLYSQRYQRHKRHCVLGRTSVKIMSQNTHFDTKSLPQKSPRYMHMYVVCTCTCMLYVHVHVCCMYMYMYVPDMSSGSTEQSLPVV